MLLKPWLSSLFQAEESVAGEGASGGGGGVATSSSSESVADSGASSNNSYDVVDPGLEESFDDDAPNPEDDAPEPSAEDSADDAGGNAADGDATGTVVADKQAGEDSPTGQFAESLLDRANKLGFTYTDVSAFKDAKALETAVRREESILQIMAQQRAAELQATTEQAERTATEPESEIDFDQMIVDGYDEKFVNVLRRQNQEKEALKQQVQELIQGTRQQQMNAAQQAELEREQRFDHRLEKLGDGYKDIFGNGPSKSLQRTTQEFENRAKVYRMIDTLTAGFSARQQPLPTEDDLFQMALGSSFVTHSKQVAREELKSEIRKAGSQTLGRPSQSRERPLTGEAAAIRRVSNFWRGKNAAMETTDAV